MYSIAWYQQDHILSVHLIGTVTIDDLSAVEAAVYQHLEQQQETVHVLIDLNSASQLPLRLNALYRAVEEHPRHGTVVLFGGSHLAGMMVGWLSRLYTNKVCYAADLIQALDFLRTKHPELETRLQLSAVS